MFRMIIFIILVCNELIQYGQIIADHTVVEKYDEIPQKYLDAVKNMLVDISGESHSLGYRIGMNLLEAYDSRFQVTTYDGSLPGVTNNTLRFGRHGSVGEADFYTSTAAVNSYKSLITAQNTSGNPYTVIGFGWCWDMTWHNSPGGGIDPVYKVRWAGSSEGGPSGDLRWGLDAGDQSLTGNLVCMDTYLNAVEEYIQHCITKSYPTKIIFTTGPVDEDGGSENGFQREIKHDYIRNYVNTNNSRILFDYADILCWNNGGIEYITNWIDGGTIRPHANIHPDNMKDYDGSWNMITQAEDGDHIGEVGALRLAKAMWWLLARIAGWDGVATEIEDTLSPTDDLFKCRIESGNLQIQIIDPSTDVTVSIYSINGALNTVLRQQKDICTINTALFVQGAYIVNVQTNRLSQSKKIIIP